MEQIWPQAYRLNADGVLWIGGCPARALAETFGPPLYVFDEITLRTGAQGYKAALAAHYRITP